MATIFVSPGVYTKEQDFSVFASRIGITRLGLVGKTEKGPAFEPIKISNADAYAYRFGGTTPELPLSYVANAFLSQANELTVTRILGSTGFVNSPAWIIAASMTGSSSGATLAVLRSKRNQIDGSFYFDQSIDIKIGSITSALGDFFLSGTTGPLTGETNSGITVSLDETKESYITKILGKSPKVVAGLQNLYVEKIYPHFLREAVNRGEVLNIFSATVFTNNLAYTDYEDTYKNATTPWIVSRVVGGNVRDLFRVQTISDGDGANREIKISIANLDIINHTFDLIVRNFNDTDATAGISALERWANLSFDKSSSTYIGKVIGTTDGEYPAKSMFITVDIAENVSPSSLPAGFRGYTLRTSGVSGTTAPGLYYKTQYFSADTKFKTYLGISELAYTSLTQSMVSVRNSVKTLEADLFVYDGAVSSATTTTKGFHLENTANSANFISGNKNSLTGYTNDAGTLIDKTLLKFTLVPYGGFDGWDKYAQYGNTYEEFTDAYLDNINAFKSGIDTMSNPLEIDINLFATPGVDFSNNETVIRYALDMIETRTDSLYIMDAPRITVGSAKGTTEEVVSRLEATGIDSNYATTYWPWIQIADNSSNIYTYQSPTLLVVKAIAYTDNVASPWFAPAGLNRGLAGSGVIQTDVKLRTENIDVLYGGRINPVSSSIQQGIALMGQKTLQVRQSALDRINVRRLLLQVRRLVAAASMTLLFEQNDQTVRDQFLAKVEPILLQIQNQRGLSGFKVVMDSTNNTSDTVDRNTLVGKIQLKPTRAVEYIDLTFQVLPTGARFEDF